MPVRTRRAQARFKPRTADAISPPWQPMERRLTRGRTMTIADNREIDQDVLDVFMGRFVQDLGVATQFDHHPHRRRLLPAPASATSASGFAARPPAGTSDTARRPTS